MRVSLNWLRELVDIKASPQDLAEILTMAGFEVEAIEDRRTWADGVVIGKILDCQPHPNADKLRVCQVDIGAATPSTIVCGAPNARADIYVPVATLGTYLPTIDLKLKPAKLRGIDSVGMICSLAELGLAKESAGIHIFDQESLQLGVDVRPLLGLDDVILDVTSTANRADALSMVGIAREVAALTGGALRLPEVNSEAREPQQNPDQPLLLRVSEPQACPVYIGTVVEQVQIAPSPAWLQQRLQSAGVRSINNVVDITNYILLEWGQPLHAFDRDALLQVGNPETPKLQMGVRLAELGESLKTLDGQTRNLQEQTLLITTNNHPVALAGVMGGEATEVQATTQNLVLEAALFDPVAIRRSARSLGLRTEASTRYERGVNHAELATACQRALQLITDIAGGTIATQQIAGAPTNASTWARTIELRLERVTQILGMVEVAEELRDLEAKDVERTLAALGCTLRLTAPGVWSVTVPPYRYRDLEREIDLIEEVARLYGYDHFANTLPDKTEAGYLSAEQDLTSRLRSAFRAAGLTELVHYSVVKVGGDRQVVITNPLFTEYSALRTELLPGLIDAFQYNLEQGNGALNGFEIGRVFWREEDGLSEADTIGGILGGDLSHGRWVRSGREQPLTWFEAKGVLENVCQRVGLEVEFQPDRRDDRLHPGRTASLWVRGNRLGTFGQLHPQLRQERGLPDAVYAFELNLDVILDEMDREENFTPIFKPYSTYPASGRDLAFFAPTQTSVAEIQRTMTQVGGTLLESADLFDEYQGDNVPSGQRSLAFRLVYRASDRTLTDAEIDPVHQQIRESLVEKFRVDLRS